MGQRRESTNSLISILSRGEQFSIWPSNPEYGKPFVNSGGALISDVLQVLVQGTSSGTLYVLVGLHSLKGVRLRQWGCKFWWEKSW